MTTKVVACSPNDSIDKATELVRDPLRPVLEEVRAERGLSTRRTLVGLPPTSEAWSAPTK